MTEPTLEQLYAESDPAELAAIAERLDRYLSFVRRQHDARQAASSLTEQDAAPTMDDGSNINNQRTNADL